MRKSSKDLQQGVTVEVVSIWGRVSHWCAIDDEGEAWVEARYARMWTRWRSRSRTGVASA